MAIQRYSRRRPAFTPFADFGDLSRFFDEPFFTQARAGAWMPAVSVSETNGELVLTAELPGLDEDDISIELENNVLTVSGEKRSEREEKKEKSRWVERSYGRFTRSFTLPADADPGRIEASFKEGVLTVSIAKTEETKPWR